MTPPERYSLISAGQHHSDSRLSPAEQLYAQAVRQPWLAGVRERFGGRTAHLQTLDAVPMEALYAVKQAPGTQPVPLAQVAGSVQWARSRDFDAEFRPRNPRLKERWLSIAARRQAGRSLPPVELIQVGAQYFVADGHHRVSVERALGLSTIQARVARLK
jgi:hypothetical protein